MNERDLAVPVFIGGKLNRVPDGSNTSLPVDIGGDLARCGAIVCSTIEAMLDRIDQIAQAAGRSGG